MNDPALEDANGAGVTRPLRLLVAHDNAYIRRGVRSVIDAWTKFRVIAEAGDAAEVEACLRQIPPGGIDAVLLATDLPGGEGDKGGGDGGCRRVIERLTLPVVLFRTAPMQRGRFYDGVHLTLPRGAATKPSAGLLDRLQAALDAVA